MIEIPCGFISWKTFYDVYERDSKLQANLRKTPRLTYGEIHSGNNKQSMPLALAIFNQSTTAAIAGYFPEKSDAACFLSVIRKLFVVCNAKTQYNTSSMLGNAAACNDSKPEFLLSFAAWIEEMVDLSKPFTYKTNIARSHNNTKSYILFTIRVT